MKIFYLDKDPQRLVACLIDSHISRMCFETARALCSVHWRIRDGLSCRESNLLTPHNGEPPKIRNWAQSNIKNYEWLCLVFLALLDAHTDRFQTDHATEYLRDALQDNPLVEHNKLLLQHRLITPQGVKGKFTPPPCKAVPNAFLLGHDKRPVRRTGMGVDDRAVSSLHSWRLYYTHLLKHQRNLLTERAPDWYHQYTGFLVGNTTAPYWHGGFGTETTIAQPTLMRVTGQTYEINTRG